MNNQEFLQAIFGQNYGKAHVCSFSCPPEDTGRMEWKGDYFEDHKMVDGSQYFCISLFHPDSEGVARRRKALYKATPVIVLDDVKEKLPMSEVEKLPRPSYILETSAGSEQWGYILTEPATDRGRVDNLLDGLVANGLAPDGRDPGMKGITRYVRLPEGINTKVKRNNFKCRLLMWEPFNTVTLEEVAAPFNVDLDEQRREARVDGAADVPDHPLLNHVHVKEVRSDGRYDITCPWVHEHTDQDDTGAAAFTNADLTIGFECHHGACQDRTGKHLIEELGIAHELAMYQFKARMEEPEPEKIDALQKLREAEPYSDEQRMLAVTYLQSIANMSVVEKLHLHEEVRQIMGWGKTDLKDVLADFKESKKDIVFNDVYFVGELNQMYDYKRKIFYTVDGFQNAHSHLESESRKVALQHGGVVKVDKLQYSPGKDAVFHKGDIKYCNMWSEGTELKGVKGDVSTWLNHFDVLGWSAYRDHIVKWMAHTLQKPEVKINHAIILGGLEGSGKDWLLTPLHKALGDNAQVIDSDALLDTNTDYLLGTKYLHVNELELGDKRLSAQVAAKIKPFCAAPPFTLTAKQKYVKPIEIENILSLTMTTNSVTPLRLNGQSRRILALWSDINVRDADGNLNEAWADYWDKCWEWMMGPGVEAVTYYLRNLDISDFNPKKAPPVTEFLREMVTGGKDTLLQTIEAFRANKIHCFGNKQATIEEMTAVLKQGTMMAPEFMYTDERYITPVRVANVMAQSGIAEKIIKDGVKFWRFKC